MRRFRGGLVSKAHRLLCHSTVGSRAVEKKKKVPLAACSVWSRVQGSRFRVQGPGSSVQGSGFSVQCSGFRVQGIGLKFRRCLLGAVALGEGDHRPPVHLEQVHVRVLPKFKRMSQPLTLSSS